jgi:thiol-disulfide isomerase/thioredoxin
MKKLYSVIIGIFFVLNGLGAVALNSDVREFEDKNIDSMKNIDTNFESSHTIFIEVGTATWCPSCPASNNLWHELYEEDNYDFEYCEMIVDKNSVANSRMVDYNLYWVPTSYFDGGENVYPGTSKNDFTSYLEASGERIVPDLIAEMKVRPLDNSRFSIDFSIENNEGVDYPGHLRIYILELESTLWEDNSHYPYYHAFLDFAVNQPINIPAGDSITDSVIWDGASEGYSDLIMDNIQFILVVFDDESHEALSDPDFDGNDPEGAPFDAYYVDETIAVIPDFENNPPDIPHIEGETKGEAGVEYYYAICGMDPDGDKITYCIDWGDDSGEEYVGPNPSGVCMNISHTWSEEGTYTVSVKSIDIYGEESDWATLEVSMPKNKIINSFERFLENHPHLFPILRYLLKLY